MNRLRRWGVSLVVASSYELFARLLACLHSLLSST
jgi:hypothetical protein